MTIIIDTTILWIFAGAALWVFFGTWGLLMGNAALRSTDKWDLWWPVVLGGPLTFIVGAVYFFFTEW